MLREMVKKNQMIQSKNWFFRNLFQIFLMIHIIQNVWQSLRNKKKELEEEVIPYLIYHLF